MTHTRRRAVVPMVLCALETLLPSAVPARAQDSAARKPFIVELALAPLAAYGGDAAGYAATSPQITGRRFDPRSVGSARHRSLLEEREARVLSAAAIEPARPFYRYRSALAGFAARLTAAEAQRLESTPGVRRVSPSRRFHLTAAEPTPAAGGLGNESPSLLGLPGGLWEQLGGPEHAGDGTIVGVIDTGIWPEHPSFAATPGDPPVYQGPAFKAPARWRGRCQAGEQWTAKQCNGKVIGARYFIEGFGRDELLPGDVISARDTNGHGTNVSGIAVGDYGVDPTVGDNDLGVGFVSGVAPRAHVAVYKTAWADGESDEGDIVAAIDAAVSDGVDVLNFSSGGPLPDPFGAMEMAFLGAVESGILVSGSAGNEGGTSTVDSPGDAPWVVAAAASTLGRDFLTRLEVVAGDQTLEIEGATVAGALGRAGLIDAAAAAAKGADPVEAENCLPGSLDPAKVKKKAVLCQVDLTGTGLTAAAVVGDTGGVAVVVEDFAGGIPSAYAGSTPVVEVAHADGERLRTLLRSRRGVTVSFAAAEAGAREADVITDFSSRGPQLQIPDVMKPDVAAPGHDVLAAVSPVSAVPESPSDLLFDSYEGTSMAAPHVAGAAALVHQAHPGWSPAAIRSALTTTARTGVHNLDGSAAGPFDTGGGRIDPNRAVEPGLVLDVSGEDYRRLVEGIDPKSNDGTPDVLAPLDVNLPSISVSALAGTAATVRRVTSVAGAPGTWRARVEGLGGVDVTVEPSEFELAPGATQALEVGFSVPGEPSGVYTTGALVLSRDGLADVRLPVAVRPVPLVPPDRLDVDTAAASGSLPFEVQAGYDGNLSAVGLGLARPKVDAGRGVGTFGGSALPTEAGPGVVVYDLDATTATTFLGGQITTADGGDPATDLDLYLLHDDEGDGFDEDDAIDLSAGDDSEEEILVPAPYPGQYRFVVLGFETREPSTFDFATWVVDARMPDDDAATPALVVTGDPAPAAKGAAVTLRLEWSGLQPAAAPAYGTVAYYRGEAPDTEPIGWTLVRIERTK
ncbi:MAG: S8 family serine peptidase [Acidimicrobiia bacterium]